MITNATVGGISHSMMWIMTAMSMLSAIIPTGKLLLRGSRNMPRRNEGNWFLPTSWMMTKSDDAFTARMFEALNAMMLDMLAAIARKDYDDRRRRQMQGI